MSSRRTVSREFERIREQQAQRIADLVQRSLKDQATIAEIAAQRDAESARADSYFDLLRNFSGGLDLLSDGVQRCLEDVGRDYREKKAANYAAAASRSKVGSVGTFHPGGKP